MKGIVLAGGYGTRLFPLTRATSKHLLPVHDKPMIFYPLSILLLAGISDIGIVCRPQDRQQFERNLSFLGNLGVRLTYIDQEHPGGIPDGILLAEEFCGADELAVVLGDNFFYGAGLMTQIRDAAGGGAAIFTQKVADPERFGVARFSASGAVEGVVEKPRQYVSSSAVVGLYLFDRNVFERARGLAPSQRGETEIADLLNAYIQNGVIVHQPLTRGTTWFDMGTFGSIDTASTLVRTIEEQAGELVGCLEEICVRMGYAEPGVLASMIESYPESSYKSYIQKVLNLEFKH